MVQRLSYLALVLLTGVAVACAGGSVPTLPEAQNPQVADQYRFVSLSSNTVLLGAWEVTINPDSWSIEAVPLRQADMHFDVTRMLKPPKCYGCFLAKNLSYDPVTKILTIDIGFRNPSNITGCDVRGIVTEFGNMRFLNPDGYTDLFSPAPTKLNPFLAFDTGVGQREYPPLSNQYETMLIYNETFPKFDPFTYVVEASWPDNCREPYEVLYGGISADLYSDGSNTPRLQILARDWQNDISSVSVDLTPIGGTVIQLQPSLTTPDAWEGPVSCAPGTPIGDYRIMVRATSAPPTDQIDSIYNFITLTVVTPPEHGPEIFGEAERVAISPGESFIWPRHAIAVTGDGTSHVVWVDNSPDPDSNIFHVYYSKREGGIWSPSRQIDSDDGRAIYATIAADNLDAVHVVWEDERDHVLGSDVYYASSEDDFATESLLAPGDDGVRNVHPKIVSGSDGTLHAVWHSLETVEVGVYEYDVWYTRRPAGDPFWESAVSVVSEDSIVEAFPAIAPASSGAAYVAFQSDKPGAKGIYFTRNTSGSFISPVPAASGDAYEPALDVAPDGSLALAYFEYLDGSFCDIYLRHSSDEGSTWGVAQIVSESQDAYQYAPDVECSTDGDFHVAWHEEDDSGFPGRVLYRELLRGEGWQDIIELVETGGMGAFPSMDSDADGHIHAVYELLTPSEPPGQDNYEIWYRDSVQ